MKDIERRMLETGISQRSAVDDDSDEADMVTIFEGCRLLQNIEFCCKALRLVYDNIELTKRFSSSMGVVFLKVAFLVHQIFFSS